MVFEGQVHEHSCQHNDSRWFSFWDHCCSYDSQWHLLTLLHSFCWWVEGVNPWSLTSGSADSGEGNGNGSEVYSLRVATWNVETPVASGIVICSVVLQNKFDAFNHLYCNYCFIPLIVGFAMATLQNMRCWLTTATRTCMDDLFRIHCP